MGRVLATVHRAIRDTIECTLREHSIVMNRSCAAFGLEFLATVHRAIRKTQLRCFPLLAQLLLLIDWRSLRDASYSQIFVQTRNLSQGITSELLYRKMYKKREKFLKKSLAILQGLLYTTKCCDMIAKKHKVAATENT
ncbi:hypothetical protein [Gallintestinimicrobium sp.]|uniref:hypothetical protein n=1 Tax=Gallintestinimicrobium sp. TaxID=2981655 RepID=UPI003996770C